MENCKLCGNRTNTIFNIDSEAVHVCESCGLAIFIQQAHWLVRTSQVEQDKRIEELVEELSAAIDAVEGYQSQLFESMGDCLKEGSIKRKSR